MLPVCDSILWIEWFTLGSLFFCIIATLENFVVIFCWFRAEPRLVTVLRPRLVALFKKTVVRKRAQSIILASKLGLPVDVQLAQAVLQKKSSVFQRADLRESTVQRQETDVETDEQAARKEEIEPVRGPSEDIEVAFGVDPAPPKVEVKEAESPRSSGKEPESPMSSGQKKKASIGGGEVDEVVSQAIATQAEVAKLTEAKLAHVTSAVGMDPVKAKMVRQARATRLVSLAPQLRSAHVCTKPAAGLQASRLQPERRP